jgi:hypothetical protein
VSLLKKQSASVKAAAGKHQARGSKQTGKSKVTPKKQVTPAKQPVGATAGQKPPIPSKLARQKRKQDAKAATPPSKSAKSAAGTPSSKSRAAPAASPSSAVEQIMTTVKESSKFSARAQVLVFAGVACLLICWVG